MVYEDTSDGRKLVEKSNVDLVQEIPDMMRSKRYLQANIKTIQAIDETVGYLLDIKS